MITKGDRAFTLIELLVVISIIGSLLAIGVPNFIGIRQRGRDSKRKVDLKEIQSALELYKLNQNPPSYPDSNSPTTSWEEYLKNGNYMKTVPSDPLPSQSYYYQRTSSLKYDLYACLENKADTGPNIEDCSSLSDFDCSTNICYHLTQP